MFNVALLSGWHVHALQYGREIKESKGARLVFVWDDDPNRGADLAAELSVPFTANITDIWNDKTIDGVIVTNATADHLGIITAAADAGKAIFTEKVLAATTGECLLIKEAFDRNKTRFCISLPHRTLKRNLFAKKTVEDGVLGEITYMRVRNAHGGATQNWLPDRFYDVKETKGGAMMDLGAHPMYLIRWILGKPQTVKSVFTERSGKGIDDNCVSVFMYENGSIAVSETGFVSPHSPYIMEIYGTKGSLIIIDDDVSIFMADSAEEGWEDVDLTGVKALPSAIEQWISGEIVFGFEEALSLTEMMEMAYSAM